MLIRLVLLYTTGSCGIPYEGRKAKTLKSTICGSSVVVTVVNALAISHHNHYQRCDSVNNPLQRT